MVDLWNRADNYIFILSFVLLISSLFFLWSPYGIGQTIIFSCCGFFFLFFLACRSQMWYARLAGHASPKKSPSGHHRTTLLSYIFAIKARIDNRKKNLLSSNISCTSPHNMVNFGLLAAEIFSLVRGIPANFNGFRVLASLLQRRRSTEANQTLHNVWPLPGLVDYVYIFGGCCSVTEFCQVQNSLCVLQVLRFPILSVTARQSSSGREPNIAATIRLGISPHSSYGRPV